MRVAGTHTRSARLVGLAIVCAFAAGGCEAPMLSQDGKLVFTQKGGRRGASIITANGVEFLDVTEVPQPVVRRSANEPWQPATGFLLPADGILRKTSTPVPVEGPGLAVVLRSSDVLVPSWGGEILLRMDAFAPTAAFPEATASLRPPERLAIVIDGANAEVAPLLDVALEALGGGDRVGIVTSSPPRPLVPVLPGSHRTLLRAAVERLVAQANRSRERDLGKALAYARGFVTAGVSGDPAEPSRHVLVLTDGLGVAEQQSALRPELGALRKAGVKLVAVSTKRLPLGALDALRADLVATGSSEQREDAIARAITPPGDVVLDDVELSLASVPAPARLVESSGGQSALALDKDRLLLGELYAGEARTEVARVGLPPWVPGERLEITVTATYRHVASGEMQAAQATLRCLYSDDVEAIAKARHGDVIAYASALAMVRRLHRAFLGSQIDRLGGLRPLVTMQARSAAAMAQQNNDPAMHVQAEILSTLLGVLQD